MAPLEFSQGSGARSHDARRGEDRGHAQGVCDLPAAGQRLAHALSIPVLFCRQQLLSQCFPVGERRAPEATSVGPQAGTPDDPALEDLAPSGIGVAPGPQSPASGRQRPADPSALTLLVQPPNKERNPCLLSTYYVPGTLLTLSNFILPQTCKGSIIIPILLMRRKLRQRETCPR